MIKARLSDLHNGDNVIFLNEGLLRSYLKFNVLQ